MYFLLNNNIVAYRSQSTWYGITVYIESLAAYSFLMLITLKKGAQRAFWLETQNFWHGPLCNSFFHLCYELINDHFVLMLHNVILNYCPYCIHWSLNACLFSIVHSLFITESYITKFYSINVVILYCIGFSMCFPQKVYLPIQATSRMVCICCGLYCNLLATVLWHTSF